MDFIYSALSDGTADAAMRMLSPKSVSALLRFWRRARVHPAMWMGVLMLLPMLPAGVPALGFWTVTALELALGSLVIIGMARGWTNEAIEHAMASKGGLYAKLFGESRVYRRANTLFYGVFDGLRIGKK